jgi:hypothetical protein
MLKARRIVFLSYVDFPLFFNCHTKLFFLQIPWSNACYVTKHRQF